MKATTIIIAAVFSLQFSAVCADNPENKNASENEVTNLNIVSLAPVTPLEADFSDVVPEPDIILTKLAPVAPAEADFNDDAPETNPNTIDLSPEAPGVADFEEITADQTDYNFLIPVVPAVADFE